MRPILRASMIFVTLAMLSGAPARSDVSYHEEQQAFAWFDKLGYPRIQNMEFARIYNGGYTWQIGKKRIPDVDYGFVIKGRGNEFSAVGFNLWPRTLTSRPASDNLEAVKFEQVDLEKFARDLITRRSNNPIHSFPADAVIPVQSFELARVCFARGNSELARKLLTLCENELPFADPPAKTPSFRDRVSNELSLYAICSLTLDFGDVRVSRQELLNRSTLFCSRYPHSEYGALAVDMIAELSRMVPEDMTHASRRGADATKQTMKQRVADLIFELRNVNSQQYDQPGSCDVFEQVGGKKSPASELAEIGLPAVPQLIDAALDSRPTRSVEFWRSYCFSHHVLRVGDAALRILMLISGRDFHTHLDQQAHREWRENSVSAQADALHWWNQVKAQGELRTLVAGVMRGDNESVGQARRLVQVYPEDALPALRTAIRNAREWTRKSLVELAASCSTPDIAALLREVATHSGDIESRVEAAEALYKRGDHSVTASMITAWKQMKGDCDGAAALSGFIANHGASSGISSLGQGLANRPKEARLAVVSMLGNPEQSYSFDEQRSKAAQSVLVSLLQDKSTATGFTTNCGKYEISEPRVCDAANATLANLWPQTYRFSNADGRMARDRECVSAANVWRVKQGQVKLPLPERPIIGIVPVSEIQPLLYLWEYGADRNLVRNTESRIRLLGLRAVPFIESQAQHSPSSLRQRLITLAKSLACTVRRASVSRREYPPSSQVVKRIARLQGTQLTSAEYSRIVTYCLLHLPNRATGVRISAYRDVDATGFQVDIEFIHSKEFDSNRDGLRMANFVLAGSEQLDGAVCTSALMSGRPDSTDMEDLVKSVHKALDSDLRVPISIVIEREFEPKSH